MGEDVMGPLVDELAGYLCEPGARVFDGDVDVELARRAAAAAVRYWFGAGHGVEARPDFQRPVDAAAAVLADALPDDVDVPVRAVAGLMLAAAAEPTAIANALGANVRMPRERTATFLARQRGRLRDGAQVATWLRTGNVMGRQ